MMEEKNNNNVAKFQYDAEDVPEMVEKYNSEITELRQHTKPEYHDDIRLYRFLKSRQFDLEAAREMLISSVKYCEENGIYEVREKIREGKLVQESPQLDHFLKCYPHNSHIGWAKDGSPVSFERTGAINPRGLSELSEESMNHLSVHELCHISNVIGKLSIDKQRVVRLYHVMDLKGLGLRHVHQGFLLYVRSYAGISQFNFPEQVGVIYIFNAPWIFHTVLSFVKGVVAEGTLNKMRVLGVDYQKELAEVLDEETYDKIFNTMDNETMLSSGSLASMDMSSSVNVTVNARSKIEVEVVPVDGCVAVDYLFTIQAKDITLVVYERDEDGEKNVLKKCKVVEKEYIDGQITIENTTTMNTTKKTIVFELDNTSSWMSSKNVTYAITQKKA